MQRPKQCCHPCECTSASSRGVSLIEDLATISLGLNRTLHSPHQVKIKILTEFYETALVDKAWKLEGVGEGDERKLLERFSSVTAVFLSLPEGSRQVCNHRSR